MSVLILLAVFHDTPIVLSLWHVAQALWNVLDAINSKVAKPSN